ncbi:hypothetical protein [Streptomyces sp. NBC_01320]|uniref:hypothetical protein n=1 Tax=Streptomyces sp. NBC_01320 TaxID=2903824 RepID=UPI002E126E86|nr:hypothetical protein OG395_50120 [Streptomyces sp. NBC_01320]
MLVADIAALQPEIELPAVGVRGQRSGAVGVHPGGREQPPAAAGPAFQDALLLGGDLALDLLVDGDQCLAFHLPVEITQIGGAVGVPDDAVEGQVTSVTDPQPAPHENQGQHAALGIVPAVEVGGLLDLGHDLLGQRPGQPLVGTGEVVGVEGRVGRKSLVPAVAAHGVEERVQRADAPAARVGRSRIDGEIGQVAFEYLPVHRNQTTRGDPWVGQETGKPVEREDVDDGLVDAAADTEPPAHEPFGWLP